jgi:hypothetical protein
VNTVMNAGSCTNISTQRGLMYRTGYVARDRDSSVGIANRYGLDGAEIESRWRARFSAPVQTGPDVHTAPYTLGESFPRVKQPGRGADNPPPSSAEVKERAIPLLSFWVFVACSRANFTFIFTFTGDKASTTEFCAIC